MNTVAWRQDNTRTLYLSVIKVFVPSCMQTDTGQFRCYAFYFLHQARYLLSKI